MLYVNPTAQADFRAVSLAPGAKGREAAALEQFEQVFLYQMLKEMRKTVPDNGLLGSSVQKQYFEEMMDDFLAGEMAASGQFGVAKQMASQIHAGELPARTSAPLPEAPGAVANLPAGIPIKQTDAGIPICPAPKGGIETARSKTARFSIERGPEAGIPLYRMHGRYREQQNL